MVNREGRGRGHAKERERVKDKVRGKGKGKGREALTQEVGSHEVMNAPVLMIHWRI